MKKILIICILLSLFSAPGIYSAAAADNPITVKVGVYENQPKVFTDDNGKVSGLWPDIIEYIASQEGWTIQYVNGTWVECLDRLKNNKIDIMMDVAFTSAREQTYILSDEVAYTSWSRVYVPKGSTIECLADLDGKTIAVMKDSINYQGPEGIKALIASFDLNCTFLETDNYIEVFKLIDNKQADAGVVSKDFAYAHEADYDIESTPIVFQPAYLHFAFSKDAANTPYLKERIDYQVRQLKADNNSVYYQSLMHWMGTKPIETNTVPGWLKWTLIGIILLGLFLIGSIALLQSQVKRKTKQLTEEIAEHKAVKNETRNLNLRQEAILSAVPDIIAEVDNNKIYTWVNPAGYQFFGEDVIGKEASFYFEGEQDVYSHVSPIFQGDDNILYLESWQRRRDGEKRLLGWWCRTLKDHNGNVKGALSTARDITELKNAQQTIVEAKAKLEAVFESMTNAVLIADTQGHYVDFNEALVTYYRCSNKEECARKLDKYAEFIEMLYPDGAVAPMNMWPVARALRGEIATNVEYIIRRKDTGKTWWGSYGFSPIKDKEMRTVGAVVAAYDITARKQVEEALKESEDKFSKAFNVNANAICLTSIADNKYMEVNEAFTAFTGYTREEVIGHTAAELNLWVIDGDFKHLNAILRKEGKFQNIEFKSRHKTGEIRTGLGSAENITIGGTPVRLVVITDITARKKAEEALKTSEENYRRTLKDSPLGILIVNSNDDTIFANRALLEIYGYSSLEEFRSIPVQARYTPESYAEYLTRKEKRDRGEATPALVGVSIIRKDGEIRYLETMRKEVLWSGERQYQIIYQDITQRKKADEALKESENSKSLLLEKLNEAQSVGLIGSWEWDLKTSQVWWSDETYIIFGVTKHDFIPSFETNSKFIHPDDFKLYNKSFKHSLKTGEPLDVDLRLITNDGLTKHCNAKGKIVYDSLGQPLRFIGTVMDITERKKADEALKESQEKFSRAFSSSPVGMAIMDYETQSFVEVNERWAEILEYQPAEMIGRTTADLNMYPDLGARTRLWQTLYKTKHILNQEVVYRTKTGKNVQAVLSAEIVPLQGREFLISTMMDITESRKTEKALIESEEKLWRIFETVPEGIILIDKKGIIMDANQAVMKMHGYSSRNKFIGKNGFDLIAPEDRENAERHLKDTLEKGVIQNVRHTLLRIDGSEFFGEMSAAVIRDLQNNPLGIVIVTSDITERIAAQEEHQKVVEYRELDRVKTNLLSTISHELRTPLASIKGYSSMLLMYDRKLNKMQKNESIEAIDRSTDRLTELIDHLLDMSRLEAGILKLSMQPVDPQEILTEAVNEAKLRSPNFRFKNEIKGKLPEIIADGRRLRQVIDNILENAVKYSPEKTMITVKTEVKKDEMLVCIADQGRGIPEGEYQKIFERMYRIEQRLQKDPGGLGLGLSLCKALVEEHGGRIWVESVIDKGSTFYFTIPTGKVEKGNENGDKKQAKIKENTRDR